jgi:hypothetical protein
MHALLSTRACSLYVRHTSLVTIHTCSPVVLCASVHLVSVTLTANRVAVLALYYIGFVLYEWQQKVALEVVARTMAPAEMRRLQAEFEKADIRYEQRLSSTTTIYCAVHSSNMSGMLSCMQVTAVIARITCTLVVAAAAPLQHSSTARVHVSAAVHW